MTPRKLLLTVCAASAIGLTPGGVRAHSDNETTVPADGAVLDAPPQVIAMTFDKPMRLTLIRLTDADGGAHDVTHSDGMAPVTEFKATPSALFAGSYTVEWRGLSADGHPMEGSFSFRVEN